MSADPMGAFDTAAAVLGYVLIVVGLIGAVVPILPGPMIIWLGALVWAWGDGFDRIGWPTLLILLVLALGAWASDFLLNMLVSRRAGASWQAIAAAIVGGLAGGLLLSGVVPVLGSLVGAVLGALAGTYVVEYAHTRDSGAALTAMRAYVGSMLLASLLEVIIAVVMVSLFAWQAFL